MQNVAMPRTGCPRLGPRSFTLSASKKRNHPPGEPGALVVLPGQPRRAAPIRNPKSGFTLVELLVTITIITMLAGLVLGGLTMARNAAREMKTKATIAKLDEIILRMYAGYADRRVPIDTSGLPPRIAAQMRLNALRRLMQLEMPERRNDVPGYPPPSEITITVGGHSRTMPMPALAYQYAQLVKNARDLHGDDTVNRLFPAEALYMIVSVAAPRDLQHFSADEIADTDGDGLLEFVDAWGNPIMFLRWAPGFRDSDIQRIVDANGNMISSMDPRFQHDPFDAHNLEPGAGKLVPLIYSAGPDGMWGLDLSKHYAYGGNPYENLDIGAPVDSSDPEYRTHYDNIHNHRLEIR